jgi:hypothetical protein
VIGKNLLIGDFEMLRILSSWHRIFIYLALISLITIVGYAGGWIMGLVFGLILTLLIELFSFLHKDALNLINKQLSSFSDTLKNQISVLSDFSSLKEDLQELNIQLNSSVLTNLLDLYGTGLQGKLTPVFLFNNSVEPNIVISRPCVTVLFLDPATSITLFVKLFDFVKDHYWGISFTKIETWEFKPIEKEAMEKQADLVKKGIEVKRVFILGEDDPQEEEKVVKRCKIQKNKYGILCRYIALNRIRERQPLREVWHRLWPNFLEHRQDKINKFILLSPDFGIIDNEILVSFLQDLNRNNIGASVFFKPYFLDELIRYYNDLFSESEEPN